MLDFDHFMTTLGAARSVGITAPAFGDGDSVGTQCALKEILEKKFPRLQVRIINETECPRRYSFLHHADAFEVSSDILREDRATWPEIMVCVDGNFERIGDDTMKIWEAATQRGQVDHHAISGAPDYDFRLYQPEAAATTEIVFDLIKHLGFSMTKTIAQSIYMGLIFDTGLFKHSNTTPRVMRIGAELLETGFNHTQTAEEGLLIRTPAAFELLKQMLGESHFEVEDRYVWGALTYESFEKSGADTDDKEGLIDQLFLTTKCEIAAFYFEVKPQLWKVSFRARKHWDVAALARTLNPQGGGHKKAAGCTLEGPITEVLTRCHKAVRALLAT
ncbi:MAG: DHH family phosphoesterase [Bdellovibrionota bacterium]